MAIRYRLAIFDVNGTLTDRHTIVDIGNLVGKGDEVSTHIKQHTTGRINLSNALMEACKLLEGVTRKQVEDYSRELPLMAGIEEMTSILTKNGVALAMLTTGFKTTMDIINKRLDNAFKYIICNDLVYDKNDIATGGIKFSVMENESKADRLLELSEMEGIFPYQCAAIGDSIGDVNMLDVAGLGIAFNPNKQLEEYAKNHQKVIVKGDLKGILPYIMNSGFDIQEGPKMAV